MTRRHPVPRACRHGVRLRQHDSRCVLLNFGRKSVRRYFENRAARIFRGRVIIAGYNKLSRDPAPSRDGTRALTTNGLVTRT